MSPAQIAELARLLVGRLAERASLPASEIPALVELAELLLRERITVIGDLTGIAVP